MPELHGDIFSIITTQSQKLKVKMTHVNLLQTDIISVTCLNGLSAQLHINFMLTWHLPNWLQYVLTAPIGDQPTIATA